MNQQLYPSGVISNLVPIELIVGPSPCCLFTDRVLFMDGLPKVNCCEDVTAIPSVLQGLYRKTALSGLHPLYFLLTVQDTVGMS